MQGPEQAGSSGDAVQTGSALDTVPSGDGAQAVSQPVHGRRGTAPGPRGCWAVKADGEQCKASALRAGDYCSAHSGLGVAENPAAYAAKGGEATAERSARRAALRLALGLDRAYGPRAALKAATAQRAGEIAGRAVDAVLDPKVEPTKAADLALRLIDAVDPLSSLTMEAELPLSPDQLESLPLGRLLALAEANGVSPAKDEAAL